MPGSPALVARAVGVAAGQVGIREVGKNRGQRVEEYLARAGAHPGDPWCASFLFWVFDEAARELGQPNPLPKTPGALKLYRLSAPEARTQIPHSGAIFVIDHGGGLGHAGLIESVGDDGMLLRTIEGNTNDGGHREGDGVYRRERQRTAINVGFLYFAGDDVEGEAIAMPQPFLPPTACLAVAA